MIVEKEFHVQCASCGVASTHETPVTRMPLQDEWAAGLDGRPSWRAPIPEGETRLVADAAWLVRAHPMTTCPHCQHWAPSLPTAYPGLAGSKAARGELLASKVHAPRARRWLAVAQLFRPTDPANAARWTLRAAWADEADDLFEAARPLRLESARLLEEVLFEGSALAPIPGRSSVVLAELYRVGGDRERAMDHCARGLVMDIDERERVSMWFEAKCLLEQRTEPFTCADARDAYAASTPLERMAVRRRFDEASPPLAPIVLRPRRHARFEELHASDADATFTRDYLTEGRVAEFLGAGMSGVASVAFASAELSAELFCALDHPDAVVRARAFSTLENRRPPPHRLPAEAIGAVLRRLEDDDVARVRAAGLLLRHLVVPNEAHRADIVRTAQRVLPKWAHDVATSGVLERILDEARPPRIEVPPTKECRRPRSIAEMRFLASLEPCPGCRKRDDPGGNHYTFDDLGATWRLTWPCAECNATRFVMCPTAGANDLGSPRFGSPSSSELAAGPWPSQVLTREMLTAELERRLALVRGAPHELTPVEHAARRDALKWATRLVGELLKFPSPDGPWDHARLAGERERLAALDRLFAAEVPRVAALVPNQRLDELARPYGVVLGLRGELRALVEAGRSTKEMPTVADLRAYLAPKARSMSEASVDLGTDVATIRLSDDAHGVARVALVVATGSVADVEAVFGALDAGGVARLEQPGRTARATVIRNDDGAVARVDVEFVAG